MLLHCPPCRRPVLALLIAGLVAIPASSGAHEPPTAEQLAQAQQQGDLQARLDFARQLENHRVAPALQERAQIEFQRAALAAQGLSPREIDQQLFGGIAMAFPYTANTELPRAGTARTLTLLVDFADMRASSVLPGLTADRFAQNIYGPGTAEAQAFTPTESVNAYYQRASEGKVQVQGTVLDWYHSPNNRASYEPPAGTPAASIPAARNLAIHRMMTEALRAADASGFDFTPYDHDNDGDIDQITLIYAGPNTNWGSFWWAYEWSFFANGTTGPGAPTFDGKRPNRFVFQFASRRGPTGQDFDPKTLIHEMGHSFGLPDYYDYRPGTGPDGGLGMLDMMDATDGVNHNAFSRWLLDWISPEVLGSTPPTRRTLLASASPNAGTKAIAVFPSLAGASAPSGEMFIIENRMRIGNDVRLPSDGLLIWHVDARPNTFDNGFLMDNSYTTPKLVRLVRANTDTDFANNEAGGAAAFFVAPADFPPSRSRSNTGAPTGVSVTSLSPQGETITLSVGVVPTSPAVGGAPAPTPPSPPDLGQLVGQMIQPAPLGDPGTPRAAGPQPAAPAQAPAPAPAPEQPAAIDRLAQLASTLASAPPSMIRDVWTAQADTLAAAASPAGPAPAPRTDGEPPADLVSQLMLTQWAAKDGPAAVAATLALTDPRLRARTLTSVLEAWAHNDPYGASAWYFAPEQAALRSSKQLVAGPRFAQTIFRRDAANDLDQAIAHLNQLDHPTEVWGALKALDTAAVLRNMPPDQLAAQLQRVEKHAQTIRVFQQAQELRQSLAPVMASDPPASDALQWLIRNEVESPRP
jgi:M6 family metalloprotease-like protein